ncbi:T-complex protein 1 subunit eta-like [Eurosta solidaginis]|uniref:T-complex protein 1 subunit eta-like n=1 Tax=Eurosta solidaginis TaxID=178769 RepID=UPI0035312107
MKACGGAVMTTANDINSSVLGQCDYFEERQIGGERINIFQGLINMFIDFTGQCRKIFGRNRASLHDAIMLMRRTIKHDSFAAVQHIFCQHRLAMCLRRTLPSLLYNECQFPSIDIAAHD